MQSRLHHQLRSENFSAQVGDFLSIHFDFTLSL